MRGGDRVDFQSINPELFVIIGELLGAVWANQLPFNVQNAIGNWLQLVGQAILTYNAQQQYYEQGPGRVFDPRNFNVDNPNCPNNNQGNTTNSSPNDSQAESTDSTTTQMFNASTEATQENIIRNHSSKNANLDEKIDLLLLRIESLEAELSELKEKQLKEND